MRRISWWDSRVISPSTKEWSPSRASRSRKLELPAAIGNVSGNILNGAGPIRTVRISAFSNDFAPLSGSGTLFELKMNRVSKTAQGSSQLAWAPASDQFIFIDAELNTHTVGTAAPGNVSSSRSQR